ncbi:PREDICTED: tyrosine-protein kinase ABL-like [Amphimedon queenslandica]|uniref:Protein kinase domain-containing protein n=1 Tax=Amphimedon queenslandica TaxID=400682 RepID=A0AAN0JWL3_AMPQE|nr:PREDICTED: tyrosine-protein kinase ABL-like [Amphimedon queenslandica]|eukprot:XP_019861462.1 PREDICTED: tyrosine-protein kinase ABL-like [Amphimedon queenslandica]
MAIQICAAMKFLEQSGFIHRNLAARNCLVGDRNIVKVGSFSSARFVPDDEYKASVGAKYAVRWSAPEVITHARFSSKSDIWSYGKLQYPKDRPLFSGLSDSLKAMVGDYSDAVDLNNN